MNQPADTLHFMIAGYVVIFGALFGYLASLAVRWATALRKKKELQNRK